MIYDELKNWFDECLIENIAVTTDLILFDLLELMPEYEDLIIKNL
jgi:hypothetical protein